MTVIMEDKEMKEEYKRIKDKTSFLVKLGKRVGKSPHTIRMWFSDNILSSEIPQEEKARKIIEKELLKAPKK